MTVYERRRSEPPPGRRRLRQAASDMPVDIIVSTLACQRKVDSYFPITSFWRPGNALSASPNYQAAMRFHDLGHIAFRLV